MSTPERRTIRTIICCLYSALVEGDYLYVLCNNCVFYAICLGDGTYVVRMLEKAATPWVPFIWRSHYFFHRFLCLPKTYSIYLRT